MHPALRRCSSGEWRCYFPFVAPCQPGASPLSVLAGPYPRTASRSAVTRAAAPPTSAGDPDQAWMARALEMARAGGLRGEVPVAALIVHDETVLAESHNRTAERGDPTAHAEMIAVRAAARRLGDWRLTGCTLYVTLEPCAQCAGAIVLARVSRLVFGAPDPRSGMAGSLDNLVQDPRLNHRAELAGGVLADESAALLRSFFRERR